MKISRGDRRKVEVGRKTVEVDEVDRVLAEFMPYVGDADLILDVMERVYSWEGDKKALITLSNRLKAIKAGLRDLGYSDIPFKRYTELTDIRDRKEKGYEG